MKNLLFLLLLVALISCSYEDNSASMYLSFNYNTNATESDNSCQYSIVGKWNVTKYMLGSTNVMERYNSLVVSALKRF